MRKVLKELGLLTAGVVIGVALFLLSSLHQYFRGFTEVAYGYPFVWRSWASASPLNTDPFALDEDLVFWLVVSVVVVRLLFQTAFLYFTRKLRARRLRKSVVPASSKNVVRSPISTA